MAYLGAIFLALIVGVIAAALAFRVLTRGRPDPNDAVQISGTTLLVGVAVAILTLFLTWPARAHDAATFARIVSVYDGDTYTADLIVPVPGLGSSVALTDQRLRLYCIDTPEVRGAERSEGLIVRDRVRDWIDGHRVRVDLFGRDKYGRILAVVWPPGWAENLTARLVREGMGRLDGYGADCSGVVP